MYKGGRWPREAPSLLDDLTAGTPCVVVERPRRSYARRRGRRLEIRGLLPDSRRIAHFLLPAVVSRAGDGLWAGPDLRKALSTISTVFLRPVSMVVKKVSQRLHLAYINAWTVLIRRSFSLGAAC